MIVEPPMISLASGVSLSTLLFCVDAMTVTSQRKSGRFTSTPLSEISQPVLRISPMLSRYDSKPVEKAIGRSMIMSVVLRL